jgi:myosin-5
MKQKIFIKKINDIKFNPSTPEPPAHLYYLVEDSYKDMIENGKNQTFIISGDSGSGKTESAKYLINYLINSSKGEINNYIMDGNEILESFGNAKTSKNDNSSRFGKLISINFSKEGKILDAHFETYLLEKSRLVKISQNERNYHIFYQLILGLNEDEKNKYCLQKMNYYNYLNKKEKDELPHDKENFNNLKVKLNEFLSKEEIDDLFTIISGILYLGNIQIGVENEIHAYIKESSMKDLKQASTLFGLKEDKLKEILTKFSSGKTTKNTEDAEINRDFISKELYSKLFNFLIEKINKKMENNINKDDTSYRIGILDIFGFENLDNNSFEQLCINYTNERLQKYFNNHVIKLEQELYIQEGLEFEKIKYKDNKPVIRLIDGDKKEFRKEIIEMIEKIENNIYNNNEILKLIDKNDSNYKIINDKINIK